MRRKGTREEKEKKRGHSSYFSLAASLIAGLPWPEDAPGQSITAGAVPLQQEARYLRLGVCRRRVIMAGAVCVHALRPRHVVSGKLAISATPPPSCVASGSIRKVLLPAIQAAGDNRVPSGPPAARTSRSIQPAHLSSDQIRCPGRRGG